MNGTIKTFFPNRKFGFIVTDDGKDVFFHEVNLCGTPTLGQRVQFELGDSVKLGLPKQAINITPVAPVAPVAPSTADVSAQEVRP